MAKILIAKGRREYVKELDRKVVVSKPKYYYVRSPDFNCTEGAVKSLKDGAVKTNTGKEFFCFSSSFYDDFRQIKRLAQIITPKDAGMIVAECGLNKQSVVVEGGSGSGALACFLAKIVKKVFSYEIRQEHLDVAKKNASFLKVKNVSFKLADITKKIDEKCDAVILDLPQPWDALKSAERAVKVGGFIVAYSPAVTQVMNFVEAVENQERLVYLKAVELIERRWKVDGKAVRPVSDGIGHTGFLVFARKIN